MTAAYLQWASIRDSVVCHYFPRVVAQMSNTIMFHDHTDNEQCLTPKHVPLLKPVVRDIFLLPDPTHALSYQEVADSTMYNRLQCRNRPRPNDGHIQLPSPRRRRKTTQICSQQGMSLPSSPNIHLTNKPNSSYSGTTQKANPLSKSVH